MPRDRATTIMAMSVGKELAVQVARVIEARHDTISDAIANGLATWMEQYGDFEIAAMLRDGRGTMPKYPMRFGG